MARECLKKRKLTNPVKTETKVTEMSSPIIKRKCSTIIQGEPINSNHFNFNNEPTQTKKLMDDKMCIEENSENQPIIKECDQAKSEIINATVNISATELQLNKILSDVADNERLHVSSESQSGSNKSSPVRKQISGSYFKDIVYRFCDDDFNKTYNKLNNVCVPECYDQVYCEKKHKDINVKVIWPNSYCSGPFFNILDNPFDQWVYDLVSAAFSTLRPDRCFRGDVLHTLFLYILRGPSEELMWDIKNTVSTHFSVHPPCTDQMKLLYLQLLNQKDSYEYFSVTSSGSGVFHHVMNTLEEFCEEELTPEKSECETDEDDSQEPDGTNTQQLTFELMEERHINYQPVLDNEYNEVIDALNDIVDNSSEEGERGLNNNQRFARLTVALELVVDLLEADFMICVSKLKRFIMGEDLEPVAFEPMIKHFMDNADLQSRVFELYARTVNNPLWTQLSRLVGMMAEKMHLFRSNPERFWKYPDLYEDCREFASNFFNTICECKWDEDERLLRLQMLKPPWLQQQVAMWWANSELKVDLKGTDLEALVDIIHMHVQSPSKFERITEVPSYDLDLEINPSTSSMKKTAKKNVYGESKLHTLCRKKTGSVYKMQAELALPETDVNAVDHYGWTPLHEAVGSDSVLKTRMLLEYQPPPGKKPVDIGAQNKEGCTPLHEAVENDNLEICELLVHYGGVCLLRKTDCDGQTPLMLAKDFPQINNYFERMIKKQELLNLSPDSLLKLAKYPIQLLIVACNAFLADHHTSDIYTLLKSEDKCETGMEKPWILVGQNTLLDFKRDQDQFRKLRRILNMLAENPKNDPLVRVWDSTFSGYGDNK